MPKNPPESMQDHLRQRLNTRAAERWPQLVRVHVRFRTGFAYVDGELKDGGQIPLCRLRFGGVLHTWNLAHQPPRPAAEGRLAATSAPADRMFTSRRTIRALMRFE
ncbi:hypothetical protein [Nocardia gipuzkoensis]|uniref:hypothetical protein n=1 Tax=Nocardia gipuzkoensis TaxID=2749991 RepID=UPI00237D657D|nr:hypothetical protein [Nocardia gipuzkoensis]MDE1675250.1 hypothetical protein [Nocardia gipuzkoensis]